MTLGKTTQGLIGRGLLLVAAALGLHSCGGGGGSAGGGVTTMPAAETCGASGSRCVARAGGLDYILYVPASFRPGSGALVLVLHPRHADALLMEQLTEFNRKADEAGFAVLYPETPLRREWAWFFKTAPDDVAALRAVIASAQTALRADPKRIYVTGYSDGAEMAHRVGVEMSDVVAAIAPVSGSLYEANGTVPAARSAVSVLILHSDLPPGASFYVCGRLAGPSYPLPSQDEIFDYWTGSSANACAAPSTARRICENGSLSLTTKSARQCRGGSEVTFYQLLNGNHGWFNTAGNWRVPFNVDGNPPRPYSPDLSATTGLTAHDVIWNFFAAHPKP